MNTRNELLVQGARLWGGPSADLLIQHGRIAALSPNLQPGPGAETIDATGCLVLPGCVDAHAHIDKTLWGQPWHPH